MTPLYFDPAVGFSSTVALSVFVLWAIRLYASRSSSRVASFATGICDGGSLVWPVTTFPGGQPQEIAASVTRSRHVFTRRINQFRSHSRMKQSSNHFDAARPLRVEAGKAFNWAVQCRCQRAEPPASPAG